MNRIDVDPRHAPLPATWRTVAALLAIALLAASCAAAVGDAGPLEGGSPAASSAAPGTVTPAPASTATPEATPSAPAASPPASVAPASPDVVTSLSVYFLIGEQLTPVQRQVPRTGAVARAAMTQLLAGPSAAESNGAAALLTVIPAGTRLLDIAVSGGIATVDLTSEFESGGGSASMFARLAQVVYTLTQFPTVDGVRFRIDGQPVTAFSSEGIILDGPSVRADYGGNLPPILVERPAWGSVLASPARITGVANVFEAQFVVEIDAQDGTVLVSEPVMATCGTGCWGTFDVTIPYAVDRTQPGRVIVYDLSARDGSRENVRSYPVTLTPAG